MSDTITMTISRDELATIAGNLQREHDDWQESYPPDALALLTSALATMRAALDQ